MNHDVVKLQGMLDAERFDLPVMKKILGNYKDHPAIIHCKISAGSKIIRSSTNDTKEFHKSVSRLSYPPVEYARTDRASMYFTNNVEIRMTPYAFLVYCYKSIKISCDIYAYIYNEC